MTAALPIPIEYFLPLIGATNHAPTVPPGRSPAHLASTARRAPFEPGAVPVSTSDYMSASASRKGAVGAAPVPSFRLWRHEETARNGGGRDAVAPAALSRGHLSKARQMGD